MTRDDILLAAARIFEEKGYHAASMQDIAQAVELQKGSLYHHVESKQDILLALLDEALEKILEKLIEIHSQNITPVEKLRLAMDSYLSFLAENRSISSVLLLEHRSLKPEYKELHIPNRDQVEKIWQEIINAGIKQGYFKTAQPGLTAKALLGVINWTITWYREDGPLSPSEIADHFTDLFFQGLLVDN
jgi:AcrR family transcriptional regulator